MSLISMQEAAHARLIAGDLSGAVRAHLAALAVEPSTRGPAKQLAIVLRELGHTADALRLESGLERARLLAYQQGVDRMRRSPYMDVPTHVHMETLARCNARCDFCPSPGLDRTGARLDDDLITKIISDLSDIPRHIPIQVSPFKVNEPLLDVRLFDILDALQDQVPNAKITLTTNASPLTRKKLAGLARFSALSTLYVSFNDHRPEAYERVMGLPYRRTVERLDTLHNTVEMGLFSARVSLSRVGDGTEVDDAFRLWCAQRWPRFGVLVSPRGDWLGQVDVDPSSIPRVGCMRWFELSITATGKVAHCCMDGQAAYPIGDVREQHLLEIYNAPAYRGLREATRTRQGASPCDLCSYM